MPPLATETVTLPELPPPVKPVPVLTLVISPTLVVKPLPLVS